jgi:hypothetical protein
VIVSAGEGARVIRLTGADQVVRVVSPSGDGMELTLSLGPSGQAQLSVDPAWGRVAVWVMSDLVLGGEEDEGYV